MELESLSLHERVGQLVWPRLGSNMQPPVSAEDDAQRVRELVKKHPVGGLIVFNAGWPTSKKMLRDLQAEAHVPLLIASDIERGMGQQFDGLTLFPHAQAFKHNTNGEAEVAKFAHITSWEAAAAGVHLAFAPVADVDLYNQNPIIATRAFSSLPEEASRLVRTYIEEAESCGLLTTAKHFPGHGRTTTDSHDGVPVVDVPRDELARTDLLPFRDAIEAGVSCIMTSHVAFPELDESGIPATRSAIILRELLREKLGFEGAVVSDSLLMEGARQEGHSLAEQASKLIEAGVDILLDVHDPEAVIDALYEAVQEGMLAQKLVDEAAARVITLKRKAGLFDDALVPDTALDLEAHHQIARKVAQGAISPNMFMKEIDRPVQLSSIVYMPTVSAAFAENPPLFETMRKTDHSPGEFICGPDDSVVSQLLPHSPDTYRLVVLAGGPAAWRASHLTESQKEELGAILRNSRVIVAALGPRALLNDVPGDMPAVCTFSDVPDAHAELASYLLSA